MNIKELKFENKGAGEKPGAKKIEIDKDYPCLNFRALTFYHSNDEKVSVGNDIRLECFLHYKKVEYGKRGQTEQGKYQIVSEWILSKDNSYELLYPIEKRNLRNYNYMTLELTCEGESHDWSHAVLEYENKRIHQDELSLKSFGMHLQKPSNMNILFSAPFGEGKSTFLNYFFEDNQVTERYEVFKVFPVNYSVASNEDIFSYIKVNILMLLLGKDVESEKEEVSIGRTVQEYLFLRPKAFVANALKLSSALGDPEVTVIMGAVQKLINIAEKISDYHKERQTDDRKKAEEYLKYYYEREGSLFEDNIYTQIITQLIAQLKEKGKETVLIIDDLDRMDPEHIFRILNVIAAHTDRSFLEGTTYKNKFGFDKIIVVCDIDNLRNIFKHRYGKMVDFEGYINKFYDSEVFSFSISGIVESIVSDVLDKASDYTVGGLENFLEDFHKLKLITVRQLLDLSKKVSSSEGKVVPSGSLEFLMLSFLKTLLSVYNDVDKLIDQVEKLDSITIDKRIKNNCPEYCKFLLISLKYPSDSEKEESVNLRGNELTFKDNGYKATEVKRVTKNGGKEDYEPTAEDFKVLLKQNIKTASSI